MTAEQLEAARAERMRQNGHGAITFEDVRTWIEETGLCIFLPRSPQAGQSILTASTATPTFVEAVAGQRTTEPTLELIAAAETLLVRLEAEGVAVRLNLAGQPGDQPDYVVAGWVLPYIYALRGDRDWRRSPQLTGSRQVSQLAVLAAKQLDSANMTAAQIRDALGREVTETAVLRALHELWKQLRIIPVVPEVGAAALWQPLRQRFQKAIAEGASTSQVTAISVLASIYLQAVIAASMEDVEMFLSPLTSRSKIREVVRGLAATRQVHTTNMGHSPMFYVAGTLPEFPVAPSFQIGNALPSFRGSAFLASYLGHGHDHDEDGHDTAHEKPAAISRNGNHAPAATRHRHTEPAAMPALNESPSELMSESPSESDLEPISALSQAPKPRPAVAASHAGKSPSSGKPQSSGKSPMPRPRPTRTAAAAHPRERSRTGMGSGMGTGESRPAASGDRRRPPMPRSTSANGNGSRTAAGAARPARTGGFSNGNGSHPAKPSHAANGNGNGSRPESRNGNAPARPASGQRPAADGASRKPSASAAKRYSFSGQAKQAPKSSAKPAAGRVSRPTAPSAGKSHSKPAHTADSKRHG